MYIDSVGKKQMNCIGVEMISMLASSAVDRSIEPQSGEIKYYEIDICCFSAKHTLLRGKIEDGLAQIMNVSE